MTAIDALIISIQDDIQATDTPRMKTLLGPVAQTERLNSYREMLTRTRYQKRRSQ